MLLIKHMIRHDSASAMMALARRSVTQSGHVGMLRLLRPVACTTPGAMVETCRVGGVAKREATQADSSR